MKIYLNNLIVIFLLSVFIYSCEKEDTRAEDEREKLEEYIESNNIETEPTSSGLYYIETEEGTGEQAVEGKYAKVRYKGSLLDGTVFDEGKNPYAFIIGTGNAIEGWHEGIAFMKVGGKATLIIPSDLAYGSRDMGTIPPYSTLIFEVELIEVYEP